MHDLIVALAFIKEARASISSACFTEPSSYLFKMFSVAFSIMFVIQLLMIFSFFVIFLKFLLLNKIICYIVLFSILNVI
nr:MAG TPA: hypothetical protein [Caudoviricetes sp.]